MPRYADDPVKHIVSFRITEEEKELLEELSVATGMNISTLLRKSVGLLEDKHAWFIQGVHNRKALAG